MTKEETIKYLEKRKEKALMLMENSKADTPINNKVRGILTRKIEVLDMAISALSEELSEDGTLTVHVSDGSKVTRVFVMGDNIFGGLYYPDSAENEGDTVSRAAYEQIMWERDTAVQQLKELGYGLGEKPKENKGDLISRQAVLDELEKWDWQDLYLPSHFKQLLDDVPSVENKGESEDRE